MNINDVKIPNDVTDVTVNIDSCDISVEGLFKTYRFYLPSIKMTMLCTGSIEVQSGGVSRLEPITLMTHENVEIKDVYVRKLERSDYWEGHTGYTTSITYVQFGKFAYGFCSTKRDIDYIKYHYPLVDCFKCSDYNQLDHALVNTMGLAKNNKDVQKQFDPDMFGVSLEESFQAGLELYRMRGARTEDVAAAQSCACMVDKWIQQNNI